MEALHQWQTVGWAIAAGGDSGQFSSSPGAFSTPTGRRGHWAMPHRPPYNCRHTYATICSMSNMNPAFAAQQLGHRVQMLQAASARWLNSSSDWGELEKLQIGI